MMAGEADPHLELAATQSRAWDMASRRGHELVTGAWQVFTTPEAQRSHWHVLCAKACRRCEGRVTIERRVIGNNFHFRWFVPGGRCGSTKGG